MAMAKSAESAPSDLKSRDFDFSALIERFDLATPVRLAYPVLWVETNELMRAQDIFRDIATLTSKEFVVMKYKEEPHEKFHSQVAREADEAGKHGAIIFDQSYAERQKQNPGFFPALRSSVMGLETEGLIYVLVGLEPVQEEYVHHLGLPPIERDEIQAMLAQSESLIRPDTSQ